MADERSIHQDPQVLGARSNMVLWARDRNMVIKHLRNGACRQLYSERTAQVVIAHLSMLEDLLADQLLDAADAAK